MIQTRNHVFGYIICILFICASSSLKAAERVTNAVTTWDDYFFYAGFQVSDQKVTSVNQTFVSEPQQDDDVEVFIDTAPDAKSAVRTPQTFQMAVSAGGGAYYSVGTGTAIPKAKLVIDYKYAVSVDGTLNKEDDTDVGYTVELAIPWADLGQSAPPRPGTIWGFNVISRDREDPDHPAFAFASLSPNVLAGEDVQNPSKWTKITFSQPNTGNPSTADMVFCSKLGEHPIPVIDGIMRSSEWIDQGKFHFGSAMIEAAAPTKDQEPNITSADISALPPEPAAPTPDQQVQSPLPVNPSAGNNQDGYDITLKNGGAVHVGKYVPPPPLPPIVPDAGVPRVPKPSRNTPIVIPYRGNAYTASNPSGQGDDAGIGPAIDTSAGLPLTQIQAFPQLLLATFYYNFPANPALTALADQPIEGTGPGYGGANVAWYMDQLSAAREAGVEGLLVVVNGDDPTATQGLTTLVQAMKMMDDQHVEYPLLALRLVGGGDQRYAAIKAFFSTIPVQDLLEVNLPDLKDNKRAFVVMLDSADGADIIDSRFAADFGDYATLVVTAPSGNDTLKISTISPGGIQPDGSITGRSMVQTYQSAWQQVFDNGPDWLVVDSWNNYTTATEIAPSRQYGHQFSDMTRAMSLQWGGQREWHAKYLKYNCPRIIAQKTIYPVTIVVENGGTLPWRVGESYSLCYRWYKDGRLVDDSAPRLPMNDDVYPGQYEHVTVGVLAQDQHNNPLSPGDYTLVFDIVQGNARWFTYVGETPLKVPVTIVAPGTQPVGATLVSSSAPAIISLDGAHFINLVVRNDGPSDWQASKTRIVVTAQPSGQAVGSAHPSNDVISGNRVSISIPIDLSKVPETTRLVYSVDTPDIGDIGSDVVNTTPADPGVDFALSDVPRHAKTGEVQIATIGLQNDGIHTWLNNRWHLVYHWDYLDGTFCMNGGKPVSLGKDVPPTRGTEIATKYQAPPFPGRYQIVWDLVSNDGLSGSGVGATIRPRAELVQLVWVTDGKTASAMPIDLTKWLTGDVVGFDGNGSGTGFDGAGSSFPAELMPPDGTQELHANPVLIGKSGPDMYPSGYYVSASGNGLTSNHRISFLYPPKAGHTAIVCSGQTIPVNTTGFRYVHVLCAAATADASPVQATFTFVSKTEQSPVTVPISDWSTAPDAHAGTVGISCPYRTTQSGLDTSNRAFLGDYHIDVPVAKGFTGLKLPNDRRIKIVAITLER